MGRVTMITRRTDGYAGGQAATVRTEFFRNDP